MIKGLLFIAFSLFVAWLLWDIIIPFIDYLGYELIITLYCQDGDYADVFHIWKPKNKNLYRDGSSEFQVIFFYMLWLFPSKD